MNYSIDNHSFRSPNFDSREGATITSIIVHSCEGRRPSPRVSSLPWLVNPQTKNPGRRVSCHYYICRNADIYQLVPDSQSAWHAGAAMKGLDNAHSIGVELEHASGMNYPAIQQDALAWLLRRLIAAHAITAAHIETHGQIALPGPYKRKVDPSDWPYAQFRAFVDRLFVPPPPPFNPARYRVRVRISTKSTGGPPYAGEVLPGEYVEVDALLPSGYSHLKNNLGFIRTDDTEPAGAS